MLSNDDDKETASSVRSTSPKAALAGVSVFDVTKAVEPHSGDSAEVDDDEKNVGKEDCDALYQECIRVQAENAKCAEKIRRINKVVRRIQKERRFLMKRLEAFGDDYHAAKLKVVEEEERKIALTLQHDQELTVRESKRPRKKVKVKRLQNAPKKPTNAFLMFCQKNRDSVQEQYNKTHKTEISRQEMTRKLAEIWQKTASEDRKTYYAMYEKDKARYAKEMKEFERKRSNPDVPSQTQVSDTSEQPVVQDSSVPATVA